MELVQKERNASAWRTKLTQAEQGIAPLEAHQSAKSDNGTFPGVSVQRNQPEKCPCMQGGTKE